MNRCIVFIAPAITQRSNTGIAMLYLTLFFESICFPTILALGMRGLGKYSKRGSGWIVGGVSGGAVVPPALGAAADASNTAVAMAVPLGFFVLSWTYALAVNFVPAYRTPVDRQYESKLAVDTPPRKDEESGSGGENEMHEMGEPEKGAITHTESNGEEISEIRKVG